MKVVRRAGGEARPALVGDLRPIGALAAQASNGSQIGMVATTSAARPEATWRYASERRPWQPRRGGSRSPRPRPIRQAWAGWPSEPTAEDEDDAGRDAVGRPQEKGKQHDDDLAGGEVGVPYTRCKTPKAATTAGADVGREIVNALNTGDLSGNGGRRQC